MSDEVKLELKITTKVPSEQYKANWEAIFGKPKTKNPILCGACGIDRTNGAMCQACTDAINRRNKA